MRSIWILTAALLVSLDCLAQGSTVELDALLLESNELLQRNQPAEALALLERHQEQFINRPEYLNNLAVALLGNSQFDRAHALLLGLVESDPVYNILFHNLLELELRANRQPSDSINPILFVQSVDSFFESGLEQMQAPFAADAGATALARTQTGNTPSAAVADTHSNALRDALVRITQSWAEAWSNKNLNRYLAFYASDFAPEGSSHAQWVANRTAALDRPGDIQIELANFEVEQAGEQVQVRFDQSYRSSNYSDKVRKTLLYSFTENGWRISQETSAPIN